MVRALLALLLSLLTLASPAFAGDTLDVKAWLARPGVKLVAVEFYATWCKPCMEAVPRWDALRKKYEAAGLRLIVVATRDPDAACANPGWTPDEIVCDPEGKIADAFHANRLPAAYLWSWQGHLLVKSGHVDSVEAAIQKYMKETPHVLVDVDRAPTGLSAEALRSLVEEKLRDQDKITVATTEADRERMRKAQFAILSNPAYKEELGCAVGEEIPPNSQLRVSVDSGYLTLKLLSLEKGCLVQSSSVPWSSGNEPSRVAEAVSALIQKLKSGLDLPEAEEAPMSSEQSTVELSPLDLGGDDGSSIKNPTREDKGFLFVDSDPKGARVVINGREVGVAPYQEELMAGDYTVICRHTSNLYKPARQTITLGREGKKVTMKLAPNFGTLRVESDPPGAKIELGGEPTGEVTPFTFPRKPAGSYPVRITLPLYKPTTATAQIGDGKETKLVLKPQPDFGILAVSSEPPGADISINGESTGKVTPHTFAARVSGTYKVSVSKPLYPVETVTVKLGEGRTEQVRIDLKADFGVLRVTSDPADAEISINGEPTGKVTPYIFPPRRSGTYEVTVAKPPLYLPSTQRVTLGQGKEAPLSFTLEPNFGSLQVTSNPPGMEILLDREETGKSTPFRFEPVPAGVHEVEVRGKQYGAPKQRPTVKRGEATSTEFVMTPRLGLVKVTAAIVDEGTSEPVTAEVRVDGKPLEDTAPLAKELLVGTYRLEVRAEGAHPFEQTIEVREGETQTVSARLNKMLPAEVMRLRELARLEAEKRERAEARAVTGNWLLASGVGAAVLGGVGVALAVTSGGSAQEASTPEDLDSAVTRARTFEVGGTSLIGVGLALLGGALIAYAGE